MASIWLDYALGDFVRHPDQPDWGMGQVQSVQDHRVTVNFEHAGKQMIDASRISLVPILLDEVGTKTI